MVVQADWWCLCHLSEDDDYKVNKAIQ